MMPGKGELRHAPLGARRRFIVQMAFIGASVFSWFTRNAGGNPNSLSDLGSTLSTQFILFLLGFALYVLAMVFATKAIRHINEAVGPA